MLTAAEAGKLLGLSARTMYDLARVGKVKCYRMGVGDGAVRFDPADLEDYKRRSCPSPVTTRAAGSTSSTARFPELDESALTSYFRKAGREPKPKPSTSGKRGAGTPLKLAFSKSSR
jgi:excisionase family DNA binding protein